MSAASLVFALSAFWVLPRVWRNEPPYAEDPDRPPDWWPYRVALWRGVVRLGPTGLLFFGVLALFLPANRLLADTVLTTALAWLGVAVLVSGVGVVLFNRPKLLVPPHLRAQPGLLDERRHD